MTSTSPNSVWRKPIVIVILVAIASGAMIILATLNLEKIDAIVGAFLGWDGGSGSYVAIYDDYLLTASSEDFFKFSTGWGRASLSKLRIQFEDGNVMTLPQITPVEVQKYFPNAKKSILKIDGIEREYYRMGFDSFEFKESKLNGVTLSSERQIAIDFGDGQFVRLPVERKKLLNLLGPPKAWEKVTGGPP